MSEALDLLAGLVLEDGRRWGAAAEPFQIADAVAILDQTGPPYRAITRARGGAKTSDLAGLNVAAALTQAPRGSRLYAVAADRDQGRLVVDSIRGFHARTLELGGALELGTYRVAFPRRDVVLEVLAADAASAWGLRPWLLTVDEIGQWPSTPGPRVLWDALTTALPKVWGSRAVVLTTASDPAHWSRRVFDHAEESPLWTVHETPGPVPWIAPERLAEERRRLPESLYRRLHLNEWVAADDRLASPDDLAACVTLAGPLPPEPGRRYVIGLDLGLKKDATVAAVAHAEPVRADDLPERTVGIRVVLDRMEVWTGSRSTPVSVREVEDWVEFAARTYNGARVRVDPWQTAGSAERLRARGIRVEEFTFSAQSVGRLAATLVTLVRDHALGLPDDPELLDELANVRLRETRPGVLRMDHDATRHDDRAVALALAAAFLVEQPIHGGNLHASSGNDGSVPLRDVVEAGSVVGAVRDDEMF